MVVKTMFAETGNPAGARKFSVAQQDRRLFISLGTSHGLGVFVSTCDWSLLVFAAVGR